MKNVKEEYTAPELEVIEFDDDDVITASNLKSGGTYELPRI